MVFDITPALFGALFAITVNIYVYRRAPVPVTFEPPKPAIPEADPHKPRVKANDSEVQMAQAQIHADDSQHRSQSVADEPVKHFAREHHERLTRTRFARNEYYSQRWGTITWGDKVAKKDR